MIILAKNNRKILINQMNGKLEIIFKIIKFPISNLNKKLAETFHNKTSF